MLFWCKMGLTRSLCRSNVEEASVCLLSTSERRLGWCGMVCLGSATLCVSVINRSSSPSFYFHSTLILAFITSLSNCFRSLLLPISRFNLSSSLRQKSYFFSVLLQFPLVFIRSTICIISITLCRLSPIPILLHAASSYQSRMSFSLSQFRNSLLTRMLIVDIASSTITNFPDRFR